MYIFIILCLKKKIIIIFRIHVHRSKAVLNGVKKMSANSFSVLYQVGPSNPFKTRQMSAVRNTLSGFAEAAHVSNFEFENQRRTFHSYGRQCVCNQSHVSSSCSQCLQCDYFQNNSSLSVNVWWTR